MRLTSCLVVTQILAGAVSSARAAPVETLESPMPAPSGGGSDERHRPGPRVAILTGALAGVVLAREDFIEAISDNPAFAGPVSAA